jgi:hypothetical protein
MATSFLVCHLPCHRNHLRLDFGKQKNLNNSETGVDQQEVIQIKNIILDRLMEQSYYRHLEVSSDGYFRFWAVCTPSKIVNNSTTVRDGQGFSAEAKVGLLNGYTTSTWRHPMASIPAR